MKKFIPWETRFGVLKVSRRHFSKILNGKHSFFGSKLLIEQARQNQSCFSVIFGNSAKFTKSESALEIYSTIIVPNKVSNTTNGTKFGILSIKI